MSLLIELDKSGAEWVIVAYASGDERMIEVCESRSDPHIRTAELISRLPPELIAEENKLVGHLTDPISIERLRNEAGIEQKIQPGTWLPRNMSLRQAAKKANHGLNYDEGPATFALMNEISELEARNIKHAYMHDAYPGIPIWHNYIQHQLRSNDRTIYACLFPEPHGIRRRQRFLEMWGHDLFRRAYAFIPQSTVGDIVNRAMILFYWQPQLQRGIELLGNVHDSLLFQLHEMNWQKAADLLAIIIQIMTPTLEINNHKFIVRTDMKIGLNWGDMHEVDLEAPDLDQRLEETWRRLK